jgi:hypothetical protein
LKTRLHRSEVQNQIGKLARGHEIQVAPKDIEEWLGWPLSEANMDEIRGVIAGLAAVVKSLNDNPLPQRADTAEMKEELDAYRSGAVQLAWDPHTADSLHNIAYTYADDEVVHVHLTYEGRPAMACQSCTRLTLVADRDADTDEMPCRGCGTVGDWSWIFAPEQCHDDTHTN